MVQHIFHTSSHLAKKKKNKSKKRAPVLPNTQCPPPKPAQWPPKSKSFKKKALTPKKSSIGNSRNPHFRTKTRDESSAKSTDDEVTEQETEERVVGIEKFYHENTAQNWSLFH